MPSLHPLDLLVVVAYLASMLGVGLYFMRRQKSTSEYLLASRNVGWFAIGLSLLSSLNSALDYIVGPASYIEWGAIVVMSIVAVFLAFPIVMYVFIPFYQELSILNCYEYLEYRFDVRVRTTASAIFIIWRICWMAFTIYLPAYALNVVMQWPLVPTIVVLGTITTIYTTIGGIRAVVWTDVFQAIIMFLGLVLAIAIAVQDVPEGFLGVWKAADRAGLLKVTATIPGWESADFWGKVGLYLHFPVTLLSVVVAAFVSQLNNYGSDQVMIQRYLSAKSLKDCQRGFLTNAVAYVIYVLLFFVLSMTLLAYFQHHPIPPDTLPTDKQYAFYFPYFIGTRLPIVMKGFIIAAIYSAAQSSVSAGISASTSVVYANFYERLFHGRIRIPENLEESLERKHMVFNKSCAVVFGVIVIIVACFIDQMGESLFGLANKIVSNFAGVMIPVFLLGMFSRHARSLGVAIGAICGVLAMFVWGFGHSWGLFERELGYSWNTILGFCVTVAVCYVVSYFEKEPPPEKMEYLWKNVMASK